MLRRQFLRSVAAAAAGVPACRSIAQQAGVSETLYNGIRLPALWPPRTVRLTAEPPPPPAYLLAPPEVIPIDVGRQLFVDHFLVEETNLKRTFHKPEYYPGNPVLKADKRWEFGPGSGRAMPFSDGVFFDPSDEAYKMWYLSHAATLYATSRDGVRWEKPPLDVRPGTNIVHVGSRDSSTVWLDAEEEDPARRFKFLYSSGHMRPLHLHFSADGIHWGEPVAKSVPYGDRTTFFYNPFRKVWVFSLRDHDWVPSQKPYNPEHIGRLRRYWEHRDLLEGIKFQTGEPVLWVMADRLDPQRVDLNVRPQLYNLDAVAYESILLGLFTIWHGQFEDREKPNDVSVGFSRDGFHWDRPNRSPFLPISERFGDWNYANVQSAGGCCLIVGDRLYFYASGRAGAVGVRTSGATSTGLAILRRDGFASMDAGYAPGVLTTRKLRFAGRHLFVNVASSSGELLVEALDESGRPVEPFTRAGCLPVRSDNTLQRVEWKGAGDLSPLARKPVRFRFHLRNGSLYSFWVSPDESGASHGYVAAGGPGFTGPIDTVGARAYSTCCAPRVW